MQMGQMLLCENSPQLYRPLPPWPWKPITLPMVQSVRPRAVGWEAENEMRAHTLNSFLCFLDVTMGKRAFPFTSCKRISSLKIEKG